MKKKERKEGRTYPRYGISSLATVTFSGTGETFEALVSNLSRGGVGIYAEQSIPVGRDVRVQVSFLQTNGHQEVTEIIPGRVVWVKPLHRYFVVGIVFTALNEHRPAGLVENLNEAARRQH